MRFPAHLLSVASAVSLSLALTACGTSNPNRMNGYPVSQAGPAQSVASVEHGRILTIDLVFAGAGANYSRRTSGTLIGTVVGTPIDGDIGRDSGQPTTTVMGASGGDVKGEQIARYRDGTYVTSDPVYRISVQTDSGQFRAYEVRTTGDLRAGDRVRIENSVMYRN